MSNSTNRVKKFLPAEKKPFLGEDVYVAEGAVLVGAVRLGRNCSIWYHAVLRGDINAIEVGDFSNIQDGAVVHVSDAFAARIGRWVTVGHRAIVHACTVADGVLVGMGAILLDGCEIGEGCVIAAGAVVPKGMVVPPGSLVAGVPGRVVRALRAEEVEANLELAKKYVQLAEKYQSLL
jgi:carbonic anhydrase/acetyltransferase-like protein (isoleucine patch superfamily)